jgi:hypothetical protein
MNMLYRVHPRKFLKLEYFLAIMDQAIMALATQFEQVDDYADRLSFLYDLNKLKETEEEDMKT